MAAYEDFEFFLNSKRRAPAPLAPTTPRDALRAELERLHSEVRRMRAHDRARRQARFSRRWTQRLGRFVARVLPGVAG